MGITTKVTSSGSSMSTLLIAIVVICAIVYGFLEFKKIHMRLKQLEMSPKMHEELKAYCYDKGVEFLSSGFDLQSIDYLVSLGVNCFKIPSGEITNLP